MGIQSTSFSFKLSLFLFWKKECVCKRGEKNALTNSFRETSGLYPLRSKEYACKTHINFPNAKFMLLPPLFPPIYKAVVVWISRLDPFCACFALANEKRRSKHIMLLPHFFWRLVVLTAQSHALRINHPMRDDDSFFQTSQPVSGDRSGLPGENSWRSAVRRAVRGDGQWTRPQDRAPHPAARTDPAPGRGDPSRQHCRTNSR